MNVRSMSRTVGMVRCLEALLTAAVAFALLTPFSANAQEADPGWVPPPGTEEPPEVEEETSETSPTSAEPASSTEADCRTLPAEAEKAGCTDCGVPIVGAGEYHPFDKMYVLGGFNLQFFPDRAHVIEFEASFVPFVNDGLAWVGLWGGFGGRVENRGGVRGSGGIALGWRFLAGDFGYVYDRTGVGNRPLNAAAGGGDQSELKHGFRTRLGLAFAWEVFTGGSAQYRRSCCTQQDSWTLCECDHNPAGLSWFVYWATESPHLLRELDHMLGVSVKVGVGL